MTWTTVLAVLVGAAALGWCEARRRDALDRTRRAERELARTLEKLTRMEQLLTNVNEELAAMVMERERRGRWLEEARARAEEANRAKSNFLAVMSHELLTPLNSVIGFSNQLLKNRGGRLSEKELQFAEKIKQNGVRLLAIIDRILDLSALEAGVLELNLQDGCLEAVVREVVAEFEGASLEAGVEVTADVPGSLASVQIDPVRMKQVLGQLLENALKFADGRPITVAVRARKDGVPEAVEIIDRGIGIPQERLAAIFEAFEQVDGGSTRRHGGLGLGLTLSKRLCDLMGFGLEVESTEGEGSTFRVVLPSGPHATDDAAAASTQVASRRVRDRRRA